MFNWSIKIKSYATYIVPEEKVNSVGRNLDI